MADLEFYIQDKNGNDKRLDDLFVHLYKGSSTNTELYHNIDSSHYESNFYYLKRDDFYYKLNIYGKGLDLNNYFSVNNEILPMPILKSLCPCYNSSPKSMALENYGYIDHEGWVIQNQGGMRSQLSKVAIFIICGGGGGGGGTSTYNTSYSYRAGGGGASSIEIFSVQTYGYDNPKYYLHFQVGEGGKGGIGAGKDTQNGTAGTPSYLWISETGSAITYNNDTNTILLYKSSYGTGGGCGWTENNFLTGSSYHGGAAGSSISSEYHENLDYIFRYYTIPAYTGISGQWFNSGMGSVGSVSVQTSTSLSPFYTWNVNGELSGNYTEDSYNYRLSSYGGYNDAFLPANAFYQRNHINTQIYNLAASYPIAKRYGTGGAGAVTLKNNENTSGLPGASGMIHIYW